MAKIVERVQKKLLGCPLIEFSFQSTVDLVGLVVFCVAEFGASKIELETRFRVKVCQLLEVIRLAKDSLFTFSRATHHYDFNLLFREPFEYCDQPDQRHCEAQSIQLMRFYFNFAAYRRGFKSGLHVCIPPLV